ncbi:aminoglycoside phosphotransferase [Streptomyces sp. NPDC051172]|uniref:aminoglycoside phosphotransferase n=1 Tax=Streptomyces sp. NPDC051172 TaxID=3155796 RepID=UPI00344862C3
MHETETAAQEPTRQLTRELKVVFGERATDSVCVPLLHNPVNAVTSGVWRVRAGARSAVVKVVSGAGHAEGSWSASDDTRHWNYWRREAFLYEEGLQRVWERHGITGPRLLAALERADGDIALWLQDVPGEPATAWPVQRHGAHAERLGAAHGAQLSSGPLDRPWLSRGFLRGYLASKSLGWELLDDDEAWRQPAVRDHFPAGLRSKMVRLHHDRAWFLDVMESLPRVFSHLDMWPANVLARGNDSVVLDWAFAGDGTLGEDIGNYIPDTVFDHFMPAARLPELAATVYSAYLRGLRGAGWRGDERLVRLAVCASAVKYDWLTAQMLLRASDARHLAYGRRETVSLQHRYRERGTALAFLADWADEARTLAPLLGFPAPPSGSNTSG